MDLGALDLPLNQGGEVVHIVGRHVCACREPHALSSRVVYVEMRD